MNKQLIIVNGNGSELGNEKALKGRAKRKMITQQMVLSLIDIANDNGEDKRKKSYWNTYHCQNKLYTADGRLYGKYCKNRFCTMCCCIRKATIINKYLPIIQTWEDPYFVTLTIKAQPLSNLNKFMKGMITAFKKINNKYRKRNQRKGIIKLIGIKSLECNFNPAKKTYNPHFHLVVPNKQIAEVLINEWLKIWTPKFARKVAQHAVPVNDKEKVLIEIVKYGSKIFTEPDLNKKINTNSDPSIYIAALSNIFTAMKGLRIFERFGFNLPVETEKKDVSALVLKDFQEWIFHPGYFDWLNSENENILTAYDPPEQLVYLLENNINKSLQ